jgi:hypothetical protein
MLDFMNQNCGKRPRCLASIPLSTLTLSKNKARGLEGEVSHDLLQRRGLLSRWRSALVQSIGPSVSNG